MRKTYNDEFNLLYFSIKLVFCDIPSTGGFGQIASKTATSTKLYL